MDSNEKFILDMEPKLCRVCERICFLKCFECETNYCSEKCLITDWKVHHAGKGKGNNKKPEEAAVSVKESSEKSAFKEQNVKTKDGKFKKAEEATSSVVCKGTVLKENEETVSKDVQAVDHNYALVINEKRLNAFENSKNQSKREKFFNGDPNSLTFKLMEPILPEHVKNGVKVSVQGRLSKAKSLESKRKSPDSTASSISSEIKSTNDYTGIADWSHPFESKIIYKDKKSQLYKRFF